MGLIHIYNGDFWLMHATLTLLKNVSRDHGKVPVPKTSSLSLGPEMDGDINVAQRNPFIGCL